MVAGEPTLTTDVLSEVAALTGHLAWPITALIVFYGTRKALRQAIRAVATRVLDKNTNVAITKEGVKISTAIESTQTQLEGQQIDIEQLRALVSVSSKSPREGRDGGSAKLSDASDPLLNSMAAEYLALAITDYTARLRVKDLLAARLGAYVITHSLSKDALSRSHDEGILLAMAAAVHAAPEEGDFEYVLRASTGIKRLHVRYRFTIALARLAEQGLIPSMGVGHGLAMLGSFEPAADAPLRRRIEATRTFLLALPATANRAGSQTAVDLPPLGEPRPPREAA